MEYTYRDVGVADLELLRQIDRAERATTAYAQDGDRLASRAVDWQVPGWHDGTGGHSFDHHIGFCRGHLDRGAWALGCFTPQDMLVGIGLMTPEVEPGVAQLAYLHVSRDHRRHGLARELVERLTASAQAAGAVEICVAAMPSESAVSFYQRLGFRVTDRPNATLLALEPEDIHLRRQL
jgi:ribosomal protein S18 acetylase RimI-like enzyme